MRRVLEWLTKHVALDGTVLCALGVGLLAASVLADLGRWTYYGGVALLVVGVALLLSRVLRAPLVLASACLAVALVAAGGSWLALNGLPDQHEHWDETGAPSHLTEDSFRQGRVLFAGGNARDLATGAVLWTVPEDSHVMTTTDETVILSEPVEDGEGTRLVARLIDTGHQVWWAEVGEDPRAIAQHAGVLVVSSRSGTVGHDLTSGVELWTSARPSGTECKQRAPWSPDSPDLRQPAVFLPTPGSDTDTVDVHRVGDGEVLVEGLDCLNAGRVVGDVVVQHGAGWIRGTSVTTGETRWEQEWIRDAQAFALPDTGDVIHIPGEEGRYHSLDLLTGEVTQTAPPDGWVATHDEIRNQRAEVLWQPVRRGEEVGLWEIGSDRVVRIPGPPSLDIAEADVSGWVAVVGATRDIVGDRHRATWAVSPEGEVRGPFVGGSAAQDGAATMADGVLRVGARVYPLD